MNKNHPLIKYFKQLHDFYGNNNKKTLFDFPFIQDSSQLFHKILNTINLNRDDVLIYIFSESFNYQNINLQNNKNQKWFSFFLKKIKEIKPKIIFLLVENPVNKLLFKKLFIENWRLMNSFWKKINLIITYKSFDLLKNQDLKECIKRF